MTEIQTALRNFLRGLFNLDEDKAEEKEITGSIRRDISFRGTNLWTLIFAMFIASIGLNKNSTAVIIGAMLISPLMGPFTFASVSKKVVRIWGRKNPRLILRRLSPTNDNLFGHFSNAATKARPKIAIGYCNNKIRPIF
jgi:hypothetical protein